MPRPRILALVLILVALGAAAIALPRLRPLSFHGTDLGPAGAPRDFTLRGADGAAVSLSDFRGRAVVLFFGYTSCPDVCPLTMAKLRRVVEDLGERRDRVQVVLVTVDPAVDTPERLREYATSFDPAFIGLAGSPAKLAEVARSFGAFAGEVQAAPSSDGGHEENAAGATVPGAPGNHAAHARMIPHTSHVFGIDEEGRFRVLWSPDLGPTEIAEDVRTLLRL